MEGVKWTVRDKKEGAIMRVIGMVIVMIGVSFGGILGQGVIRAGDIRLEQQREESTEQREESTEQGEESTKVEDVRDIVFRDIEGHWAKETIERMVKRGYINGYEDGTYRPEQGVTKAEVIKMLMATAGVEVRAGDLWYAPYVEEAERLGVLEKGAKETSLSVSLDRYRVAHLLSKYTGGYDEGYNVGWTYKDEVIHGQYRASVEQVKQRGLMVGIDRSYEGRRGVTRGEMAVILERVVEEETRVDHEYVGEYVGVKKSSVEGREVPVLMYHHFTDEPVNTSMITGKTAREHLDYILAKGYEAIWLDDLYGYLKGEIEYIPEKSVVITTDDGYLSVYEELYPLVKERNMKISVAPVGISVGRRTGLARKTWGEKRELMASGLVEVQNHTYDLHYPEEMVGKEGKRVGIGVLPKEGEKVEEYRKRIRMDWERMEEAIERELGNRSKFMVYPFGRYTEETERVAREMFEGSLTVKRGTREYKDLEDLWEIPRYNMDESTDITKIIR